MSQTTNSVAISQTWKIGDRNILNPLVVFLLQNSGTLRAYCTVHEATMSSILRAA
jgi:hypothetical protein